MKQSELDTTLETAQRCKNQGHFSDAINLYTQILSSFPQHSRALNDLGLVYLNIGQNTKALQLIEAAIEYDPRTAEFHNNLGVVLQAKEDLKLAEQAFRKTLTIDRDFVPALLNIGIILLERGQIKASLKALERAMKLAPKNINVLTQYAQVKKEMGLILDALELQITTTKLAPHSEIPWLNLSNTYMDLDQWDSAHINLKRSIILAPHFNETWSNLGFIHVSFGRFAPATNCFERAIIISSDFAPAYGGLAEINYLKNQLGESLKYSEIAIKFSPDDPHHYKNRRALQLLAMGCISEGWTLRDARLSLEDKIDHRGRPPRWDGQPLNEKTLLITAEEGVGDEIFYASCFNDAIDASKRCFIECDKRLVKLFERSFPSAQVLATQRTGSRFKPVQSYYWLQQQPPVDHAIESGSLFKFFRSRIKDYDDKVPYIIPDKELSEHWKNRINVMGSGLKIGFCWRSKYQSDFRNHHYTSLVDWMGLFALTECHFISLQYGQDWEQEISELPDEVVKNIITLRDVDTSDDMETVFAIASNLDLIISPSSTVSWIGGSLNIPTWVLHLRPNHTQLGTNFFPGFPSMKSFPKDINESWDICFTEIARELEKLKRSR